MPEPILDPEYWRVRRASARDKHHAIFRCPLDVWQAIERKHTSILTKHITHSTSILDVGCGWGRLHDLLPPEWKGGYLGVDIAECFVAEARKRQYGLYMVGSAADVLRKLDTRMFDVAVLISFRPMVRRNLGEAHWELIESELRRVCHRRLYLEYDVNDEGTLEC